MIGPTTCRCITCGGQTFVYIHCGQRVHHEHMLSAGHWIDLGWWVS